MSEPLLNDTYESQRDLICCANCRFVIGGKKLDCPFRAELVTATGKCDDFKVERRIGERRNPRREPVQPVRA